ncbi:outer membrane protein assembly factor BamB [Kineosphaera limosa]|uniref:Pyrrolo-quinoline quinone repeat domain-containing protein n=1 Tax=Kineosphaera limosa NBRC 100340 TaxID=1184609 RepID=K6WAY0_9MICO|nr:PQQ-binding-like beta-propeller repeat protein [Kineosphaera limosa]NYE00763.1 outer membrane protein assembly factor BamB [Kineosphaera limosa]GAB96375.1 hypothetical protein KILIM_036_00020 [Kineosphaera limosa NBRC 100340]
METNSTATHPGVRTLTRRTMLQATGALGLAAGLGSLAGAEPAAAAPRPGGRAKVTSLGPALVRFSLMSAVLAGDILYIGSRNILPARVLAYDVVARKIVGRTDIPTGYAIQAMAADPSGRYLYIGMLANTTGAANLYRWDLSDRSRPAEALGEIGDRDVRDMAVAPDGTAFAVGSGSSTPPALWQFDPATKQITNLGTPDEAATTARAVAATATTVFFGAGSQLGGGSGTSRASLFAYDRAARTFANITPKEMLVDPSIREMAVVGDRLVAGTAATGQDAKIAVIDLADPSKYQLATLSEQFSKTYAADGETVYYATANTLESISTKDAKVTKVDFDGPTLGEVWGIGTHKGSVIVASGFGFIAHIDPRTKKSTIVDLHDVGAEGGAQSAMGIAAGGGYVYVGGNNTIARHSMRRHGRTEYLPAPGEMKDAEVLRGVLYTGQYSGQGIWTYDPRSRRAPRQAAAFPSAQNRPLDTCWDPVRRRLLVAVQADTEGGGALWTFDPASKRSAHFDNPIDDVQLVRAVATRRGTAYLGGDNAQATGPRGTVVAFDPAKGKELWRLETKQAFGVGSLAVVGKHLYGMALKGGFFVIDLDTRKIVHTADHGAVCPQWSSMIVNRGHVYVASDTTLMRFNPTSFAMTVVVPELNGGWYSGCHVNNDESGRLYTLRGTDLVMIEDRP